MGAIFAVTAIIRQYQVDPRIRQMILQSSAIQAMTVRWRSGGKTEDDDQLELLSGSTADHDDYATIGSDEEDTYEQPRAVVRNLKKCPNGTSNILELKLPLLS
ncbi:unnamed protein product [Anisakis simplex]|uniref:Solute carrier family 40 protein n=1 Tax=Anisakis simplex TaxID=6269 RepID=A0A0M3J4D0_ANISI|nr:unnamed protein product [Anisakis simplex]